MIFSAVRLAVVRLVRERVLFPIVGRVVDHYLRQFHDQQGWKGTASVAAHVMIENSTALGARNAVTEAIRYFGPHLGPESIEVLQYILEIAEKHSPMAN